MIWTTGNLPTSRTSTRQAGFSGTARWRSALPDESRQNASPPFDPGTRLVFSRVPRIISPLTFTFTFHFDSHPHPGMDAALKEMFTLR